MPFLISDTASIKYGKRGSSAGGVARKHGRAGRGEVEGWKGRCFLGLALGGGGAEAGGFCEYWHLRNINTQAHMHWIYAHLIGDYLIQNDWMAKGKKTSSWICLVHIATYLLPFLFCGLEWWLIAAIGAQHFAQDRTGAVVWLLNTTGKTDFAKPPMAPWSIIIVDNIIHILFISLITC